MVKNRLRSPGISDFTKTEGHLQDFLYVSQGNRKIKNTDLLSAPAAFKSFSPPSLGHVQDKPRCTRAAQPAALKDILEVQTCWTNDPGKWPDSNSTGGVTASGQAWEGWTWDQKNNWSHFPHSTALLALTVQPSFSRQHHLVKHPDSSQDSLQAWLYDCIFYNIFHKAGCYFPGNSLMSYWAMGRFSSLMVTAVHFWHRHIDCISVAPKFSSFNRGFIAVFASVPRMSLLKIYRACLLSWTVCFSSSIISTLSSGSELKSIQKYNVGSIMTHFSRINHCLPHHKHGSHCTQSPIWNPLLPIINSTGGGGGLLSSLSTWEYTWSHHSLLSTRGHMVLRYKGHIMGAMRLRWGKMTVRIRRLNQFIT